MRQVEKKKNVCGFCPGYREGRPRVLTKNLVMEMSGERDFLLLSLIISVKANMALRVPQDSCACIHIVYEGDPGLCSHLAMVDRIHL